MLSCTEFCDYNRKKLDNSTQIHLLVVKSVLVLQKFVVFFVIVASLYITLCNNILIKSKESVLNGAIFTHKSVNSFEYSLCFVYNIVRECVLEGVSYVFKKKN